MIADFFYRIIWHLSWLLVRDEDSFLVGFIYFWILTEPVTWVVIGIGITLLVLIACGIFRISRALLMMRAARLLLVTLTLLTLGGCADL